MLLQVFLSTLMLLKGVYESEDKAAMVTPLQIGLQLIDWTDPQKAVYVPPSPILFTSLTSLVIVRQTTSNRTMRFTST